MIPEPLARWIRGEADNVEFERWLYANTDLLERVLGKDRALELIELDWRRTPTSPYALEQMRMKLVADARKTCVCPLLRDRHALPLTVETRFTPDSPFTSKFLHLLPLGPHGSQVWRCKACKQAWLVNVDQDDDIWYLQRLTDAQAEDAVERDRWPNTFDDFDLKWPSGPFKVAHHGRGEDFRRNIRRARAFSRARAALIHVRGSLDREVEVLVKASKTL